MKYILTMLLFLATSCFSQAQTRIDATMLVDSAQREFIVSIPSGAAPSGGYPLVFMFHGTSQNGEIFYNESQWKEKGEVEKFITVFPTALRYCIDEDGVQRNTTKWHNGELEEIACPGQYLKNDLHFVRAMIDSIKQRFPIDARKIYASGFSNGAGFASKLAVEMSDVFSAVAVSGGALSVGDSAAPVRPIPVWFSLGTLDDKWLASFAALGITEFPFNDSTLMFLSRPIRRFLAVLNLKEEYTRTEVGRTITYIFRTPAVPSDSSAEFRFTLINNMFHVYPNGSNVPIMAADIFWDFFSNYSIPLSAGLSPSSPALVSIYPNPAREFLVIEGTGETMLVVRNILGREVFRSRGMKGAAIRLPQLTKGMYTAEIGSGRQQAMKLLVIH
jgi:polyhydroxybutyrate depolymerase